MGDIDCSGCDLDCSGCDLDCSGCNCGECLSLFCCDDGCGGGDCYCCCLGGSSSSGHGSNSSAEADKCLLRCCCWCIMTLLAAVALVLIMAFAVVRPVHVTVEDASLTRLALAGPNGTSLAYDVSLAIAVRNRNWAMPAKLGTHAPLDAELLFSGVPVAHVRLLQGIPRGGIRKGKTEVYHAAASGESVQLGSSEIAEFVKESAAGGVFRLELKLTGDVRYPPHTDVHMVNVTCPLELPLSSATAVARFTKVECV